ncbi:unnamed protein product [Moneuplotes crassus]|uniref:Uncharacterized protein n=1 Tax=Euplotes crassus TaxID=5936 RepID=A0AAD2D6X6_EUPCR|nr:unnamed protein product [Moneuplotes crassus]
MEATKTINLTELETAIEDAWTENKVPFFFDTQGNAEIFFKYKANLVELSRMQVALAAEETTVDDVKEKMRAQLVYSLKAGDAYVIFLDKLMGKFEDYYDEECIPKELFDPTEIVKPEIYKKILKEDEDVDNFGNKGGFYHQETFRVVVLSTRTPDSEDNSDIAEHLEPEKFEFIKIE